MKAIVVLISPMGEEWFDAYGPMTKSRIKATKFVSEEIAEKAVLNRYGRDNMAFWGSERQSESKARQTYKEWTYRILEVKL
jgi:uncharacterized protein YjaZ